MHYPQFKVPTGEHGLRTFYVLKKFIDLSWVWTCEPWYNGEHVTPRPLRLTDFLNINHIFWMLFYVTIALVVSPHFICNKNLCFAFFPFTFLSRMVNFKQYLILWVHYHYFYLQVLLWNSCLELLKVQDGKLFQLLVLI